MKWKKLGNIFNVENIGPWINSHAANSVAERLYDDVYRIYFSCRDKDNKASIGFVDLDILDFSIKQISNNPVISPGEVGTFDDSGTSLSCIIHVNDTKYLYYLGWNLGVTVPWRNSIGLAIYNGNSDCFEKVSKADFATDFYCFNKIKINTCSKTCAWMPIVTKGNCKNLIWISRFSR